MALGTFSGGGLGMGVAFTLVDNFTKTAEKIQAEMGKLDGAADKMAAKVNRSMNLMKGGAAVAAVGAAILAPFVKGLEAASDYTENMNKLEVAFGSYSDKVRNFTDNIALDKVGLGKNQASEMASLFGDMSTGMGFAQKEAANLSIDLVTLAGDLNSFKNLKGDRAQNVLKGIFTGETESLKGIGVVMTQAALDAHLATKGINKSFKDLSQVDKVRTRMEFVQQATKNAANDFENTGDSYANMKRKMVEANNNLSITFGQVLEPVMSRVYGVIGNVIKVFDKLAQSKVGKVVLGLVAALGALLVVGGLTLVMLGGMRFLLLKSASAFGATTKATLIASMANATFAQSLRMIGKAAWASLGPYALIVIAIMAIIAVAVQAWKWMDKGSETMVRFGFILLTALGPIGMIIAGIVGIRRGFRDLAAWDGQGTKTGILGFFMRVAGVIEAVSQIWKSFNGDTFTLTKSLADKLEALGILDWVIRIGTFISRIKAVWNRVVKGFVVGWGVLKGYLMETWGILKSSFQGIGESFTRIFTSIKKAVQPLIDIFHRVTKGMFKTKGSLSFWKKLGDLIGKQIVLNFKIFGFTIKWIIQLVAWLVEGIIWAISKIVEGVMWLAGIWINMWTSISEAAWGFISGLFNIGSSIFNVGVSIVQSLWDGFKSMFPNVADWIESQVSGIFNKMTAPFKWLAEKTGQAWDWATGDYDKDTTNPDTGIKPTPSTPTPVESGTMHENSTKSPTVINNTNNTNNSDKQPIILQTVLDGEVISEKVVENLEMKEARS